MPLHNKFFKNKNFVLYLVSQLVLCSGGFLNTVAAAALLYKTTNSGAVTGFGIVCAPLPGVVFSLLAGKTGDRLPIKGLLITIEILRASAASLFIFCDSAASVFAVMLILSSLDVFYSPSKNKMLAGIIEKDELITGNSLLCGAGGVCSIISPAAAGVIVEVFGTKPAFFINSACFLLSALFLSGIKIKNRGAVLSPRFKNRKSGNILSGIRYSFNNKRLRDIISASAVLDCGTICVNIAFYALAFDFLCVTGKTWGLMLSTVYGMSFFAMIILLRFKKQFDKRKILKIYLLLLLISCVWFFYSFAGGLLPVIAAECVEGLALSLCGTLILTGLLKTADGEFTARVLGTKDFACYFAKLFGAAGTFILIKALNFRIVFKLSAAVLFISACVFLLNYNYREDK